MKSILKTYGFGVGITAASLAAITATAADSTSTEEATRSTSPSGIEEVFVTARRRVEDAQDVPIALSVVNSETLDATGTYSVSRIAQLVPSFQYMASNPRNTNFTVRGLGSSFGLANDGLEPGVGLYIDQVYFARPSTASFDLVDIDRVEILRGPQGTVFGKNTTAGALNVSTRAPSFTPEGLFELSGGDYGFRQAKAAMSGPLVDDLLAGRVAFSVTDRDGNLKNVTTDDHDNDQKNYAGRAQLLYTPTDSVNVRLSGDYSTQDTRCCTQAFVLYGPTLKPEAQQFPALAAAAGYAPPSVDPYDRKVDVNGNLQGNQDTGGFTLIADWDVGAVTLTSVSGWHYWDWKPHNDRDYMALSVLTQSANPDKQDQYSQELRVASNGSNTFDYVVGVYWFNQTITAQPVAEYGADATAWLLTPSTLPTDLLDGYRSDADTKATTDSYAAFAQVTWNITDRLAVTPGLRYTYEKKKGRYDQTVSGGLATTDPALIAKQLSIARPQSYRADFSDGSTSGQVNVAYAISDDVRVYTTYARGYKSGGINMAGIPTDPAGNPALATAVVDPEHVSTVEVGLKTQFFGGRATANLAVFDTDVDDYQAQVVDTGPGALRGYLANVDQVRVRGVELDLTAAPIEGLTTYTSVAWNDGEYKKFPNGPCPLELISSSTTACDLTGEKLPGVSDWAVSSGAEYSHPLNVFGLTGGAFVGVESNYRSSFSSDAADSRYMDIDSYTLVNLRAGYRTSAATEFCVWSTNLLDENYLTLVSAQSGNSGAVYGIPGDTRAVGATFRMNFLQ